MMCGFCSQTLDGDAFVLEDLVVHHACVPALQCAKEGLTTPCVKCRSLGVTIGNAPNMMGERPAYPCTRCNGRGFTKGEPWKGPAPPPITSVGPYKGPRLLSDQPVKTFKRTCLSCMCEVVFVPADLTETYESDGDGGRICLRFMHCPNKRCGKKIVVKPGFNEFNI